MSAAAYLYPWDVVGDPAAPDRIAGLGLDHVVLAAAYHATRAITPRHPGHRIVVAEHSAVYFPSGAGHPALRSPAPAWMDGPDPFGAAVTALRAAGVAVHAWVVGTHVDGLSSPYPVINAFGDRYPWALCPANDEVVAHLSGIAAEVAALDGIDGIELEACGWYGFEHMSTHDKAGTPDAHLMSLCFCPACESAQRAAGLDPDSLRRGVREGMDPDGDGDLAAVRATVAERLRDAVVAAIRAVRTDLTVLLHAHPSPERTGAFTGVDVSRLPEGIDGLVVNCWNGPDGLPASGLPAYAGLLAVEALGGRPDSLADQARDAATAGAAGLRLYHAGLASDRDLATIRELTIEQRSRT